MEEEENIADLNMWKKWQYVAVVYFHRAEINTEVLRM